jgi:fimbrial chaperone protein
MLKRLVGAIAVILLGQPVLAAGLSVSPVIVNLDQSTNNTTVVLKNETGEAKRYELEVNAWGESAEGQMQLAPTKDLIFFPPLITLKPGEQRNVRVGLKTAPGDAEKSYRLFIQEMPREHLDAGAQTQLQVLTRLGLAVFVVPPHPKENAKLADLKVEAGKVSFKIKNDGNVHVRPNTVVFSALDGTGKTVFEKSWGGWYVLANGTRNYAIDIPAADCAKATTFKAEAVGDHLSISTAIQGTKKACVK